MAEINIGAHIPRLSGKIRHPKLLHAFQQIDRARFLDSSLRPYAAADCALPIGHAQTTSQPLIIGRMLEMMLNNRQTLRAILEVGAGCGYQTAILSALGDKVVAIERIGQLARQTATRMRAMGYNNVHVLHVDGFNGYSAAAPFDGIVVCAECGAIPNVLVEQLAPEGLLVLPLTKGGSCRLIAVNAENEIVSRREAVSFVPMRKGKC